MSNRTDLTLMLDNRANVSKETVGLVKISGNNINVFEINADGSSFTNQITFNNIVVPNYQTTIVSRNARVRYQLAVTFPTALQTAAAVAPVMPSPRGNFVGGTVVLNDPTIPTAPINTVLRAFPLQSVCNNVQLIINGATTSLNPQYTLSALQRTLPHDWIMNQALECPAQSDDHSYFVNTLDGQYGLAGLGLGHSNKVFSSGENSLGATRGSFVATSVTRTAGGTTTYNFDVSESILVSPFTIYDDEVWLSNINTMSLMFNYNGLNDMLLLASSNITPAGTTVTITSPKLELSYMQLSPDLVSIPRITTLPYENIVYFNNSNGNQTQDFTNATRPFVLQSDTLRLSSLPEKIYVFCRPSLQTRIAAAPSSQADTFLSLGNLDGTAGVSVSIGTRTGLLASASVKTLYRMAKKNGYRGSYFDWYYGSGSLLIIDPVMDLGIDPNCDVLPGESGSVNFQINCTFNPTNIVYGNAGNASVSPYYTATQNTDLMVVVVYSGTANITPDGCTFNTGELSHSEVGALLKTAPKDGSMTSTETFKPTVQAGSLFSKFKSVLGTAASALKSDAGQKALGMVGDYLNKKGGSLRAGVLTRG